MRPDIPDLVYALAWPPVWALVFRPVLRRSGWGPATDVTLWGWWLGAGLTVVIDGTVFGDLLMAAAGIAQVMLAAVMWWLSRRRRRRAPKLAGAKSRALLAAVVAKLRESLRPRPVLRPVPGGAR
jgi:hypothetical protein